MTYHLAEYGYEYVANGHIRTEARAEEANHDNKSYNDRCWHYGDEGQGVAQHFGHSTDLTALSKRKAAP